MNIKGEKKRTTSAVAKKVSNKNAGALWEPFLICLLIGPDWLCWLVSGQIKNGSDLTVHLKLEKLKAMSHILLTYFFRPQAVWEEIRNSRKARLYYTTMKNFAHRFPFILFVFEFNQIWPRIYQLWVQPISLAEF